MSNYHDELIQIAAVACAMAQIYEQGSTALVHGGENAHQHILDQITNERWRQEKKWGTRTSMETTREWWLTVLIEEVGEMAKEILENPTDRP